MMHNLRGIPQGLNNLSKEDRINNQIAQHNLDLYAVMETVIYNKTKAPIPIKFNKVLNNNIQEEDPWKDKDPLGASTLIWANEKITL